MFFQGFDVGWITGIVPDKVRHITELVNRLDFNDIFQFGKPAALV
jgi:hypothetical protein